MSCEYHSFVFYPDRQSATTVAAAVLLPDTVRIAVDFGDGGQRGAGDGVPRVWERWAWHAAAVCDAAHVLYTGGHLVLGGGGPGRRKVSQSAVSPQNM